MAGQEPKTSGETSGFTNDYWSLRRGGPGYEQGAVFDKVLPVVGGNRAIGNVLQSMNDSLLWANLYVFAPVDRNDNVNYTELPKWVFRDASTEPGQGKEVNKSTRFLGGYHILTAGDGNIRVDHSHNWKGAGMLGGMISQLTGIATKILALKEGLSPFTQGSMINQLAHYESSSPMKIDIPFVLFTYDDPINDILIPIAELCYLTYPFDMSAKAKETVNSIIERGTKWIKEQDIIPKQIPNWIEQGGDILSSMYSYYRYAVPHYFGVGFSNKTFQISPAVVTGMRVSYHGPWVGKAAEPDNGILPILDAMNQVGTERMANLSRVSTDREKRMGKSMYDDSGYPSYATVTLSFMSLEPAFAQDFWVPFINDQVSVTSSMEAK